MTISATQLQRDLIDWTVRNSGHDEHRPYIGLSTLADCERAIYNRFFNRTGVPLAERLKHKAAHEIEENIKARFRAMGIYSGPRKIVLHGGLVRGHTDGGILGALLEIKTVPMEEHIPASAPKIPFKVKYQSQAYMHYGSYDMTLVLYYARASGAFRIFELLKDRSFGHVIDEKVSRLVEAVTNQKQPACECGRCR